MTLITVLDDSLEIRNLVETALQDAGFETRSFARASAFEQSLPKLSPDVCIMDLGLPDKDGLALINMVSAQTTAAILIISGRSNVQDRIVGLELGADDYLTKPFEVGELVARVRALLRRSKPTTFNDEGIFQFAGWTVDLNQHLITHKDGTHKGLSSGECQVLRVFLSAPNRLVTREHLLDQLGEPGTDQYDRAIDVRISRLRSKFNDDPHNPQIIKTIYGAGYIFISHVTT